MRRYTLLDGYTATNGYVIKQDPKGYLWLGTDNGAVRFDGKKFQVLRDRSMPADQEILSCNPYGKDQVLLVPLLNNIAYYKEGEVISGRRDYRLNLIRNTGQNTIFTDAFTGNIWLSNETRMKTLYCFSANAIKRIDVPDSGSLIVAVRNNKIICSRHKQHLLWQYDLNTKRYQPIYDNNGMKPFACNGFIETKEDGQYIFIHDKATQWIRIYAFKNDSTLYLIKKVPRSPLPKNSVVFTDKALHLWYRFLDGGIAYLDKANDHPPFHPFYFMDKTVVNYVFADRQQNIWISGQNNSLYFLSHKHFQNALRVHDVLPCSGIPKSVNGDSEGNIALGYVNKNMFSIRTNGKLRHYQLKQSFYEGVRCILPLGNSRFLIMDKDLALVDGHKNSIHYFNNLSTYKDISLYVDGGLLVASQSNAFYLRPGSLVNGGAKQVIFGGRTSSIASLADSSVLVGTPDGLFIKKRLWSNASRINHPELNHINITDIADKGNNGALISTNGQGIYYFDSRNGTAKAIQLFHEMSTITVRRIFKQNDSLYWLATEKGAYEVQFDEACKVKHIRNYTFYDGLPSNNITGVYVSNDTAFITTTEGPGIIPLLDTTILQMDPPLVYLNAVRLQDTLLNRPGNDVELSCRQHEFMLSLSAISYESFGNISYRYKLEGLSDEWTETNNPEIYFSGLAPGAYLFRAYASNAKGVRSKTPVTLSIRIAPAFWQTWLFKAGVCLAIALLFYFIIRGRINRLALRKYEQAKQARKLAELELEAIKAHINPHFIYNCLNSIQYFNYEKQHDLSKQYLDLFAQLIRFTIQYSRQAFITIAEETAYLDNYLQLEQMRFRERLQYKIIVADTIDTQLTIPAMLIQPYVENALKHGIAPKKEGGHVIIRFALPETNLLEISVEDDGAGFTPDYSTDKGSLGLRLSGSRAGTYNQLFGMKIQISFQNKKNVNPDTSGTIVQIKIPIHYEHALL